jgi:hypothetical protein
MATPTGGKKASTKNISRILIPLKRPFLRCFNQNHLRLSQTPFKSVRAAVFNAPAFLSARKTSNQRVVKDPAAVQGAVRKAKSVLTKA